MAFSARNSAACGDRRRVSFEVDNSDYSSSIGSLTPTSGNAVAPVLVGTNPPSGSISARGATVISLVKVKSLEFPPTPECLKCPVSRELMREPVMAADGVTYERSQILALIHQGHVPSEPGWGKAPSSVLIPNAEVKAACSGYAELRTEVERQWRLAEEDLAKVLCEASAEAEETERRAQELQQRVEALQGARSHRTPKDRPERCSQKVPPLAVMEEVNPDDKCCFTAGFAPRSARSERPALMAAAQQQSQQRQQQQHLQQKQFATLAGIRAAFTPRLEKLGWTPRER